jgi:hypothetical protein
MNVHYKNYLRQWLLWLSFLSFPGAPGHSRDHMVTMGFEGGVSYMDMCTVAFDQDHLATTADVVVPDTFERVQ